MAATRHKYFPYESVITFNDDPDLVKIEYTLPSPPGVQKIDGFGLAPDKQVFVRQHMPMKLVHLDKKKITPFEKWQIINANPEFYAAEVAWIKQMWHYRLNGYWFFNNGVPTFITGLHFFYLNFWYIDSFLPDYRSRDRKFFLFEKMCNDDDVCLGMAYLKHRREGATSKAGCWNYEAISRLLNVHGGIQSKTGKDAKKVLQQHVIKPWRKLPFFFKPITEGTDKPKNELNFSTPVSRLAPEFGVEGLDSYIDFEEAGEQAYDGTKMFRYHSDEFGKCETDIAERHQIIKPCLHIGNGKAMYTSTVGEMEKGGGTRAKKLCDVSQKFIKDKHGNEKDERTVNGGTLSGLQLLYISAAEGFEGDEVKSYKGQPFIDKHGNGNFKIITEYILHQRTAYEKKNKWKLLSEFTRNFPLFYRECWRGNTKNCNFNEFILHQRIEELTVRGNPLVRIGNFRWHNNERDTYVIFEDDDVTGKFEVSWLFPNFKDANRYMHMDGRRFPDNVSQFVAGGDPTKYNVTEGLVKSKAAGAVFMKKTLSLDHPLKERSEWISNRFVCVYNNEVRDKHEYIEDMIMMCHYYGCEMFPEINVPTLWDGFNDRGYDGYLFYQEDERTGYLKKTPGANTSVSLQQEIYEEFQTYINLDGLRECHSELLIQCRDIEDDMRKYDLFVAAGYALLGSHSKKYNPSQTQIVKMDEFYDTYDMPVSNSYYQ